MPSEPKRLLQARKHLRELEDEIQRFVDNHPDMSQRQMDNHPKFKRLLLRADNAERVVNRLEGQ